MIIDEHRQWLIDFYKEREWYQYSPFIRLNFLMEEVGELAQTVRTIELGRDHPGEASQKPSTLSDHLKEELADVLDQVLILSDKYNLDVSDLMMQSENKLKKRFNN
ncbi:MazG nucleotide pyrophosphohydrolase domain-containing protein [Leuconostoc rapi]|uniref:MazG nucleotide pyrophosphohydrolase domain-containing protein n=1 Tax=Leuconostoc rapi TaxID=1406906 RepID=UPI00195D926E|nr:MazG-like family protein [Leuconostoc rapi]MBM7435748.1 NTP pyrophosphatase (non-canonical NTP hydrolase) [Leuconostoc rapi]